MWERLSFPEPQVKHMVLTLCMNMLYEHGVRTCRMNMMCVLYKCYDANLIDIPVKIDSMESRYYHVSMIYIFSNMLSIFINIWCRFPTPTCLVV